MVASLRHTCVRINDGTAKCWGGSPFANSGGQPAYSAVPIIGLSGVTEISAGSGEWYSGHMCAVFGTGSVACWGINARGQVGNGQSTTTPVPVEPVGL